MRPRWRPGACGPGDDPIPLLLARRVRAAERRRRRDGDIVDRRDRQPGGAGRHSAGAGAQPAVVAPRRSGGGGPSRPLRAVPRRAARRRGRGGDRRPRRALWAGTTSLDFAPDGAQFATAAEDGKLRTYDSETGTLVWTADHEDALTDLAYSPDGTMVATTTKFGSDAFLWDRTTWRPGAAAATPRVGLPGLLLVGQRRSAAPGQQGRVRVGPPGGRAGERAPRPHQRGAHGQVRRVRPPHRDGGVGRHGPHLGQPDAG